MKNRLRSIIFFSALIGVFIPLACAKVDDNTNVSDTGGTGNGTGGTGNGTGSTGNGTGSTGNGGSGSTGNGGTGSTGNGTGGISVGGTGNTGGGVDACSVADGTGKSIPPVVQLLIDTSGSMAWGADGGQTPPVGQSKMELTRAALKDAFSKMENGSVAPGVSNFPSNGGGMQCGATANMAAAVLTDGVKANLMGVFERLRPMGNTPTHKALRDAYAQVRTSRLPGAKYVLLITDGSPTADIDCTACTGPDCISPTDPIVAEAKAAANDPTNPVKTFVIGVPGSDLVKTPLSQIAEAGTTCQPGGTNAGPKYCHFDMTDPRLNLSDELIKAFKLIFTSVFSCDFDMPPAPTGKRFNFSKIKVWWETVADPSPHLIPRADKDVCGVGWFGTPPAPADTVKISLCPDICEQLKAAQKDSPTTVKINAPCKE